MDPTHPHGGAPSGAATRQLGAQTGGAPGLPTAEWPTITTGLHGQPGAPLGVQPAAVHAQQRPGWAGGGHALAMPGGARFLAPQGVLYTPPTTLAAHHPLAHLHHAQLGAAGAVSMPWPTGGALQGGMVVAPAPPPFRMAAGPPVPPVPASPDTADAAVGGEAHEEGPFRGGVRPGHPLGDARPSPGGASEDPDLEEEAMEKLQAYIRDLGGQLEDGWTVGSKKRATGSSAGQFDVYFFSPAGKRFRSRQEVAKALGLLGGVMGGSKPLAEFVEAVNKAPRSAARAAMLAMSKWTGPSAAREAQADPSAWSGRFPGSLAGGVTLHTLGALAPPSPGQHTAAALYPAGYTASRVVPLLLDLPTAVADAATAGNPLQGLPVEPAPGQGSGAAEPAARTVTLVSRIVSTPAGPNFCVFAMLPGGQRSLLLANALSPDGVWQAVWEHQRRGLLHVRGTAAAAAAAGIAEKGEAALPPLPAPPQHLLSRSPSVDGALPGPSGSAAGGEPTHTPLPVAAGLPDLEADPLGGLGVASIPGHSLTPGPSGVEAHGALTPPPPGGTHTTGHGVEGGEDGGEGGDPDAPSLLDRITQVAGVAAEAMADEEVRAAATEAAGELPPVPALLACLEPFECLPWGRLEFGLCDIRVLQALEELPGAGECAGYVPLADRPGGVAGEVRALAKEAGRMARDAARAAARAAADVSKAVGRSVAAILKPRKRLLTGGQLMSAKRARTAVASGMAPEPTGGWTLELGPLPGEAPPWRGDAASHPGGLLAGLLAQGKGYTETSRSREAVARVVDRVISKLEEKERKGDKDDGKPGRGRFRRLDQESSAPASPLHDGFPAASDGHGYAHDDGRSRLGYPVPSTPPAPPLPLGPLLARALADASALPGAPPEPAAAQHVQAFVQTAVAELGPEDWPRLLQVWDFVARFYGLLGLAEPLSLADTLSLVLPFPGSEAQLRCPRVQRLAGSAAAHLAHVGMCLTRWVTDDVYCAVVNHLGDTPHLKKRELMVGLPPVDGDTWQEVARRYLLGAAAAHLLEAREVLLLSMGHPPTINTAAKPSEGGGGGKSGDGGGKPQAFVLPHPLTALDPQSWLQLLLGGTASEAAGDQLPGVRLAVQGAPAVKAEGAEHLALVEPPPRPGVVPLPPTLRPILLPAYTTRSVGDALLAEAEAAAMCAAERMIQGHTTTRPALPPRGSTPPPGGAGPSPGHGGAHPAGADAGAAAHKFKIKIKSGGGVHGDDAALSIAGGIPPSTPRPPDEGYGGLDPKKRAARERADILAGRQLLLELCRVKAKKGGTGVLMGVCVSELVALLRMARGVDFKAVAARLDAGVYQATGYPAAALLSDLQSCITTWRVAADKVSHKAADKAAQMLPPNFDTGGPHLASECEKRLAQLQGSILQPTGDVPAFSTGVGHRALECAALRTEGLPPAVGGGSESVKTEEEGSEGGGGEDGGRPDPHALSDPHRPFCPVPGACRACWRPSIYTPPVLISTFGKPAAGSAGARTVEAVKAATWAVLRTDPWAAPGAPGGAGVSPDPQHGLLQCGCCGDEYHPACLTPAAAARPPADDSAWLCPACLPGAPTAPPAFSMSDPPGPGGDGEEPDLSEIPVWECDRALAARVTAHLRLARLLATHDLQHPVAPAGSAAGGGGGVDGVAGWGVRARLALLHLLTEAACETTVVRGEVDRQAELREKSRREQAALKSKVRKGPASGGEGGGGGGDGGGGPLTGEESARLSALAAAEHSIAARGGEDALTRRACLGEDRYGNRYWFLAPPATADLPLDPAEQAAQPREAGAVMVEVVGPLHAGTPPIAGPGGSDQAAASLGGWPGWAAALKGPLGTGTNGGVGRGGTDEWAVAPAPRLATGPGADPSAVYSPAAWAVFNDAATLGTLVAHLWPRDPTEGALRTALLRVRGYGLAATPARAAASPPPVLLPGPLDTGGEDELAVPESAWCHPATLAALPPPGASGGVSGLLHAMGTARDAAQATAMRDKLHTLFEQQATNGGMRPDGFWGSLYRQALWQHFLASCEPSPGALCAATTLLEGMLRDAAFRPHARYVARPPQHPRAAATWAAIRYRVLELESAVQLAPPDPPPGALAYGHLSPGGGGAIAAGGGGKSKSKGGKAASAAGAAGSGGEAAGPTRASGRARHPSSRVADGADEAAAAAAAMDASAAVVAPSLSRGPGRRGGTSPAPPLPPAAGQMAFKTRAGGRKGGASDATYAGYGYGGSGSLPGSAPPSPLVAGGGAPLPPPAPLPGGYGGEFDQGLGMAGAQLPWGVHPGGPSLGQHDGTRPAAGAHMVAPPPPPPGRGIAGTPAPLGTMPLAPLPPPASYGGHSVGGPPMPLPPPRKHTAGSGGGVPMPPAPLPPAPQGPLGRALPAPAPPGGNHGYFGAGGYGLGGPPAPPPPMLSFGGPPAPPPPPFSVGGAPPRSTGPRSSRRPRAINAKYMSEFESGEDLDEYGE